MPASAVGANMCQSIFKIHVSSYPEGTIPISGYASVFGVVDLHGATTTAQTFAKLVSNFNARKNGDRSIEETYMQFSHKPRTDVGRWTHMEIDSYGLYVEGYIEPKNLDTQEMFAQWRLKPFNGLSVGGVVEGTQQEGNKNIIVSYDVWEISLVKSPSNQLAYFDMPPSESTRRSKKEIFLGLVYDFIHSEGHK